MAEKKIIAIVGATGAQGGGLVRAIIKDKSGEFAARALTRNVGSDKAKELAKLDAEVMAADRSIEIYRRLTRGSPTTRVAFRWSRDERPISLRMSEPGGLSWIIEKISIPVC